jgi:carbonic anhydrase
VQLHFWRKRTTQGDEGGLERGRFGIVADDPESIPLPEPAKHGKGATLMCDARMNTNRMTSAGVAGVTSPQHVAATPDAALARLTEGNARYVANQPLERDFSAGRASRTLGQAPFAAILGCVDSRVAPELAFDQSPGDVFVVRVAGNFVTPEGLGSLEFGAAVLGTKVILVLGHSNCGAVNATITALREGNTFPGHIADLVDAMQPGIAPLLDNPSEDLAQSAVIANVCHNVERLKRATPILSELVARQELWVVGGVYDLASGKVNLV